MTVNVNFLSPKNDASELRTMFRQLALLWKFELRELSQDGIVMPLTDNSVLVIDLGAATIDYQEVVISYLKASPKLSLLFASHDVCMHPTLKSLTGVNAVACNGYERNLKVEKLADDKLLNGVNDNISNLLRFNGCRAGNIDAAGSVILLRADNGMNLLTRSGPCYTIAIPIWQFGIVSFPGWFRMIENALFFNDGIPHLAPGPYTTFRIDDMPVTGESYIKQGCSDALLCSEIHEIQAAHRNYGARIEYMLSSHVINCEGKIINALEVAPKAFRYLQELYERGEINVGAHGFVHLDTVEFRRSGRVLPQEFLSLDLDETRTTLKALNHWLKETFGDDRFGFVAPAWGYKEGVTKPTACNYFSYIADSNQHLQSSSETEVFGSVHDGCVHMYETWRSGMSGINLADKGIFRAYLDAGLPVHLMLQGPFVYDPLKRRTKWVAVIAVVFVMGVFNAAIVYALGLIGRLVLIALQGILAVMAYSSRRRIGWLLRLLVSRLLPGCRLQHIARAAREDSAQWMFVGDLSKHMRAYSSVSMSLGNVGINSLSLSLFTEEGFSRPISLYMPFNVTSAIREPDHIELSVKDNAVHLVFHEPGEYQITVNF